MLTLKCQDVIFEEIAAILWDKDGTLANSHPFLMELAKVRSQSLATSVPGIETALLKAFGCYETYSPTGLMAVGTRYENEIAAATYVAATGKAWPESLHLARAAFAESDRSFTRKADFTPPFAEISALLRQWHMEGLTMAVLSGDTTINIHDFLERYALSDWIAYYAGSEAPPVKPDPKMVERACKKLGVSPQQCLVIGDSALDAELARNSGCRGFVSVTWGGSPAIAEADAIVHHPKQFCLERKVRLL